MQSLKKLVDANSVTVCAVIHQPRKVIFDLFDSLILLSVGGKMCFHGPTHQAKSYFQRRGYQLPEGESVADWLIDISSGQLAPDEDSVEPMSSLSKSTKKRVSAIGSFDEKGGDAPVFAAMQEDEDDAQALRRDLLNQAWIDYFDKKNKNITKKSRLEYYHKPQKSQLPQPIIKPGFVAQLWYQLDRAVKVGSRNAFFKFVDAVIIVFVGVVISWMQGTSVLSIDADPQGIRLKYLITEDPSLVLSEENDDFLEQLFAYAMGANEDYRQ